MGQALGCGAHLETLRRTSVAEFDITQAHTIASIEAQIQVCHFDRSAAFPKGKGSEVEPRASEARRGESPVLVWGGHSCPPLSLGNAASMSAQLSPSIESLFVHPRELLPQLPSVTADEPTVTRIRSGRPINLPELSRARQVKVFAGQRDLIAIATRVAGTLFHPKIVFPAD
jgi:tRNA pseudouridine55 synthase